MRPSMVSTVSLLITIFTSTAIALDALSNSPCAVQCGNVLSSTSGADIVCNNGDYTSIAAGITFQSCVTCQLGSTYVDPVSKKSDLQLGLYNLRYAVSWCLFGYPNNTQVGDTPCITSTACGPLESAFEFDSLSDAASIYSYCALMVPVSVPKCNACLAQTGPQNFTSNFVTVLNGACTQQPVPGKTISISGSIFSNTVVNVTIPSAVPTGTYTPSNSTFTLGAKIGVAVAGIVVLLAIAGVCIICRGKRRRRSFLLRHQEQTGYAEWVAAQQQRSMPPTPSLPQDGGMTETNTGGVSAVSSRESGGHFFDSPLSQRPLVSNMAWGNPVRREDESPAEKVYFSPYTSQYNSPVSATDQIQVIGQQWPLDRKGSLGDSSRVGAGKLRQRSRSPKREKEEIQGHFELQNVAPVLHHPGHGRHGSNTSTRSLPLTEEDYKNGNAV